MKSFTKFLWKTKKFYSILIFLCFSLFLFFAVKGFSKNEKVEEKDKYGGVLIIGSTADASILVPMLATDAMSHDVASHILRGVIKFSPDLRIVGDLARDFEISEDERVITFYLRKGIKWEDGKELTVWDVKFAFDLITDPKTPTPYGGDFKEVEKFEVLDNYTFRVTYKRPFALALMSWGNIVVLPSHILKGKDMEYIRNVYGVKPIGNGPFKLVKWKRGQEIVLKYNPLYFRGRPYLDYLIYKIVPDPTTLFMELCSGGVDWISLTPLQYKKLTENPELRKNFNIYKYPSFSYTYIGYNLRHPLFKDKRVRKALCYAINKEEIVKGALLGQGIPIYGPYKPGTWFYNPAIEKTCPYSPKKALELLKQAGFKKGKDGILEKDGRPFEFTLLTNQGNFVRFLTAQIIQRQLAKIGIKVHIRVMEWTTLIHQFIMKRRFEAVLLGWAVVPDPDLYDIFHSSKIKPPGLNFIGYSNPELDKLLEKGRNTLNQEERKKIYFRVQEILAEDQPYTFLYIPMSLQAIHKRFKNVKEAPIGVGYNIERWWVPKSEQRYFVP